MLCSSLWPLCVGGGGIKGEELGGDRQEPRVIPGNTGTSRRGTNRERTWVPRPERRAAVLLGLTARFPPPAPATSVPCLPKGTTSKLHTPPLSGLVQPPLLFQVPPGFLGPALQNPVPRTLPQAEEGAREGHHVPHTKEGVGLGWATVRQLLQQPLGSSPSLPKAAGAPRLGPNLEGRGRFNDNNVDFFPQWGLFPT